MFVEGRVARGYITPTFSWKAGHSFIHNHTVPKTVSLITAYNVSLVIILSLILWEPTPSIDSYTPSDGGTASIQSKSLSEQNRGALPSFTMQFVCLPGTHATGKRKWW